MSLARRYDSALALPFDRSYMAWPFLTTALSTGSELHCCVSEVAMYSMSESSVSRGIVPR
jgi:hypothetical protein